MVMLFLWAIYYQSRENRNSITALITDKLMKLILSYSAQSIIIAYCLLLLTEQAYPLHLH